MTVSSSTNRASYSGNGSLTTFAYGFKVFDQDDLTVILRASNGTETVQTIITDYTVTGVGDVGGGNVVFGTAPASGVTVVILREMDLEQGLDLVPNDPFPAQSLENSLDKLTFMVQQHSEELGRTIKASRTNVISGSEFTISAADRANKVFAFDSSGDVSITQEIGTFRGDWATATAYEVRDIVKDTSTNNIFLVNAAHTSSGAQPLTTNANSAKYDLLVDAAAAATSATAAASSATDAETAQTASEAAQAASEAAQAAAETAETNAETAETNAETAQAAAEAAQAAAELVYDNFDDRYLGAKSTSGGDPTLDNDGDALIDGALFFDTTNNVMKVYNLGTTTWLRTTPTTSDQTNINTVSGIQANVTTVAGISTDVTTVSGISSNVTSVAGNEANINSVAADGTDIGLVADDITNVNTVATNIASVNTNAANITDIQNASANAATATTQAGIATTKASEAAASASAASTSEDNADTSEANALTYSSNAATSAAAAASSAAGIAGYDLDVIAETIADTAVDVFVYDTSKDSDGGAWRKRTQGTSWYNETLNTATRGSRKEFPAVAVIVAESLQVTIYDGDDPDLPMWMVFNTGGGYPSTYALGETGWGGPNAVVMLNGTLCTPRGLGGLPHMSFIDDACYRISTDGLHSLAGGVAVRNSGMADTISNSSKTIVNGTCNDVAMTVLPNAPIDAATGLPVPTIAVATNGGVSVIKDDGTVASLTTSNNPAETVSWLGDTHLAAETGGYPYLFTLSSLPKTVSGYVSAETPSSDFWHHFSLTEYANTYNYVLTGTNGTYGNETVGEYLGSYCDAGFALVDENFENYQNGSSVHVTSNYNTGWMNGDIKLATLSDTDDTDVTGSELVTNGTFDSDVSGWSISTGSASSVSGRMELVNGQATQSFTTVVGETYVLTLTATNITETDTYGLELLLQVIPTVIFQTIQVILL